MMSNVWNIILESNTFNFLIFILFLGLILKKINLKNKIINLQQNTENEVNTSKRAKKDSQSSLMKAESMMKKVDEDTEKIINDSKNTAEVIAKNIISSASTQIEIINKNAKKVIENDEYKVKKSLSDYLVKKSLEQVESDIKNKINKDSTLHQKYIDEAINELEGINFQ